MPARRASGQARSLLKGDVDRASHWHACKENAGILCYYERMLSPVLSGTTFRDGALAEFWKTHFQSISGCSTASFRSAAAWPISRRQRPTATGLLHRVTKVTTSS